MRPRGAHRRGSHRIAAAAAVLPGVAGVSGISPAAMAATPIQPAAPTQRAGPGLRMHRGRVTH